MRYDHHIMGGTVTNTLAGEYSLTIAGACALHFPGTRSCPSGTARYSRKRLPLNAAAWQKSNGQKRPGELSF